MKKLLALALAAALLGGCAAPRQTAADHAAADAQTAANQAAADRQTAAADADSSAAAAAAMMGYHGPLRREDRRSAD